ncbi:MAG: hypothetical protein JNM63_07600, partial [Spirochaetia bacterium]|nr:hypothetical protein [Spirochaetia bacterium]
MHGFVINGEISLSEGKSRLELYGVLEDETPFVWTEDEPYILGFVLSGTDLGAVKHRKVVAGKFKTMDRKELDLVYFDTEEDHRAAGSQLPKESLIEWDVNPVHRFLMEKKIRGGVFFENAPEIKDGVGHFHKPAFKPSTFRPNLRVMSFDIEIGVESKEL